MSTGQENSGRLREPLSREIQVGWLEGFCYKRRIAHFYLVTKAFHTKESCLSCTACLKKSVFPLAQKRQPWRECLNFTLWFFLLPEGWNIKFLPNEHPSFISRWPSFSDYERILITPFLKSTSVRKCREIEAPVRPFVGILNSCVFIDRIVDRNNFLEKRILLQ